MKEFFGFGGYERSAEGYFSWQHLLFVSLLLLTMTSLAIYFGIKNRNRTAEEKNKVLVVAAILIDAFEIFKITVFCLRGGDLSAILYNLPLFLCSIQLITIPLAAFSRGRLKDASLDFVFIFGLLGAVLGTVFAGNNYAAYPVLSIDNVVSGITHCISGFTALYIGISKSVSMKKSNIKFTLLIMLSFCIAAYITNRLSPCNYMFLMRGDGTPYDILFNLVAGNPIIYPILVVVLFFVYIAAFYFVFFCICKSAKRNQVDK